MKILKILLILLVPAIGIVGCRKSECNPKATTTKQTDSGSNTVGARETEITDQGNQGGDVVGSGDDDRDGGDKKAKKVGH